MNRSSINRRFGIRNSVRWLSRFLFLFSSGGFVLSPESSGVNLGSRVRASATAWGRQSLRGRMSPAAQRQTSAGSHFARSCRKFANPLSGGRFQPQRQA
jgi:hypothetical protein